MESDSLEHLGIPALAWPSLAEGEQSLQKGTSRLWSPEIGVAWHGRGIERPKEHRPARLAERRGVRSGRRAGPRPRGIPLTQQCLFYPEKETKRRKHKFSHSRTIPGASQVTPEVKNLPANPRDVRDTSSIPGLGRSSGGGHGNPLQCSPWRIPWTERSLVGYSPWGRKELDTTEWLSSRTRTRGAPLI